MTKLTLLILYSLVIWSCGQAGTNENLGRGKSKPDTTVANSGNTPVTLTAAATATPCPTLTPRRLPTPASVPEPLYGVTVENVENFIKDDEGDINKQLAPLLASLSLSRKPTVRLIFNQWGLAGEVNTYQKIAHSIRPHGYVLGTILDSFHVKDVDVPCYLYRTARYVDGLGGDVDVWEVGNEVNGGWLRRNENVWSEAEAQEVGDKVYGTYKIVEQAGGKTALTLYYNDDKRGNHCWDFAQEEMFKWAQKYIPPDMKEGLDYVLVSFYEDDPGKDCRNQPSQDGEDRQFDKKRLKEWKGKPLNPDWVKDFSDLAVMFPNAKIGFGECGTKPKDKKKQQLTKYYKTVDEYVRGNLPSPYKERYVGGYFWWYYRDDMVPQRKELWGYLNNLLKESPAPR